MPRWLSARRWRRLGHPRMFVRPSELLRSGLRRCERDRQRQVEVGDAGHDLVGFGPCEWDIGVRPGLHDDAVLQQIDLQVDRYARLILGVAVFQSLLTTERRDQRTERERDRIGGWHQ